MKKLDTEEEIIYFGPGLYNEEIDEGFKDLYDKLLIYKKSIFDLVERLCNRYEDQLRLALNIAETDGDLLKRLVARECEKRRELSRFYEEALVTQKTKISSMTLRELQAQARAARISIFKEGAVIDLSEVDSGFIRRLRAELDTSELASCLQCGVCAASCPVREIEAEFNPRKIMKLAKLGLKEQVLCSNFIWFCSMCFMCQERCPQGVRLPEVMTVLRNMAAKEGIAPPSLLKLVEVLSETGRIYPIDDFTEDERNERDLPEVEEGSNFVRKIAEAGP